MDAIITIAKRGQKNSGFNGVDFAIPVQRSNQLSYDATDVGSWPFVGSHFPWVLIFLVSQKEFEYKKTKQTTTRKQTNKKQFDCCLNLTYPKHDYGVRTYTKQLIGTLLCWEWQGRPLAMEDNRFPCIQGKVQHFC